MKVKLKLLIDTTTESKGDCVFAIKNEKFEHYEYINTEGIKVLFPFEFEGEAYEILEVYG